MAKFTFGLCKKKEKVRHKLSETDTYILHKRIAARY